VVNIPSGASIILLSGVLFLMASFARNIIKRKQAKIE
jgi:ABC-type Mn2+/Zn2+ transport system permease subunit